MLPFSFIHAADFHLDTPFAGLSRLPDQHSRIHGELKEATFKAFENVIDLCFQRSVDFLLVAGDVYDSSQRSLRAQIRFRDGLKRLSDAGIRSYVIHGNHDPLDGWLDTIRMPDGVHVFGPEIRSVVHEKEGEAIARIHGISYPTRRIGKRFGLGFQREGDEKYQIGLFHCHMGANPWHDEYAPRAASQLAKANLDYWALGHIHELQVHSRERPFIAHSGNTQGRHMQEKGPRSVLHVRVDEEGHLPEEPESVQVDAVRWLTESVSITGLDTTEELLEKLEQLQESLIAAAEGRPVVARIRLEGYGPLHRSLSRPNAQEDLALNFRDTGTNREPFVWLERLEVQTSPDVDVAARRQSEDFLGDLLKLVEEMRKSPAKREELMESLSSIYDHSRAGRNLTELDEEQLLALLAEAEERCVEIFVEPR